MSDLPNLADVVKLPENLPPPVDDGACDHLPGMTMPKIQLPTTGGGAIDLGNLPGRTVIYAYPRTRPPHEAARDEWDMIPGARGCTPETCAFRDHHAELRGLGASVYGLSTQSTAFQQEVVDRLHLPFALISDERLGLVTALRLPTMVFDGATLIRRLTLVVRGDAVEHVFYPIFPPDRHAAEVRAWLAEHP
jgi:peroxiredoxin